MSRISDVNELIEIKNRRLQKLNEKLAFYGKTADPSVLLEIEDIERELRELKNESVMLGNRDFDEKGLTVQPDVIEQDNQSGKSDSVDSNTQPTSCIRLRNETSKDGSQLIESYERFISIGRSPKSDIQVPEKEVSWEHGQIILMQAAYHYRHLSKNSSSVVNRRGEKYLLQLGQLEEIALRSQDRLTIGKSTFVIEIDLIDEDTEYIPTDKQKDI